MVTVCPFYFFGGVVSNITRQAINFFSFLLFIFKKMDTALVGGRKEKILEKKNKIK